MPSDRAPTRFFSDEPDRIHAVCASNYARLAGIKRQWDPSNRFRLNQNIRPE